MPRPGPRTTYRYSDHFKATAVRLSGLPGVAVQDVAASLFSTVLTKYLPNGWVLSLSNEVYTDPAGIVWEGQGLAPEIDIPVSDRENPLNGHIEAVHAVIRLIDQRP